MKKGTLQAPGKGEGRPSDREASYGLDWLVTLVALAFIAAVLLGMLG